MSTTRLNRRLCAATAGCLLALSAAIPVHADETGLAAIEEIQDLQFGESLFYFFQGKYFSSATRLLVAQEKGQLHHHGPEARLLLGGLYLSYGMFDEAERIFQEIIDQVATPMVRNHAWFHLGELFYQRGRLAQAQRALLSIKEPFPPEYQERRILLLASIYLADKQYEEAVKTLQLLSSKSVWAAYGRFNLGVALIRLGRLEDGVATLTQLATLNTTERELLALKDKANLAIGFALLRAGNAGAAEAALARARLRGPYSNEALFGMAQALYAQNRLEDALSYWQELAQRSSRGAAVLEAKIAIPQTFFKLKSYAQALSGYEEALEMINEEIGALDRTVAEIKEVNLLDRMLSEDKVVDELDWLLRPNAIPDPLRHHFITQLLASHAFNEALKTYRDLRFFQDHLLNWRENIAAYEEILALRRKVYEKKLPVIQTKFSALPMQALQKRFNSLSEEVAAIERENSPFGVANEQEKMQITRLESIQERLNGIQDLLDPDLAAEYRERHRVVNGVLTWNLGQDFKPRLRVVKKQLKETREQMATTAMLRDRLLAAQERAPAEFGSFATRIENGKTRIERLLRELEEAQKAQENTLRELALERLQAYKGRLTNYKTEAQFVMAQIYDAALQKAPPSTPQDRD